MSITEKIRESIESKRGKGEPAKLPAGVRVPKPAQLPPEDALTDTVLFGCIVSAEYLADAQARLRDDDWPLDWQRRVWSAIKQLAEHHQPVNIVTLDPLLMEGADYDLLLRAACSTANPYSADWVGALAALGRSAREREAAVATVAAALAAE
jgi:hypothetical protein